MLENSFHQATHNIAKAGAYYTDLEHCRRLSEMFWFPEGEVSILEPSAGDGEAVKMVTKDCKNRHIFAVELRREAAEQLRADNRIKEVICCDFLSTKISNGVFSFCFANPPYIADEEGRMEIAFLKKLFNYIAKDGIIVYVVPYGVAVGKEFLSFYLSRFEHLHAFKFDAAEYAKYKQIVYIGRKKKDAQLDKELLEQFNNYKEEDFKVLPATWQEDKIEVFETPEKNVVFFTSIAFDEEFALKELVRQEPQAKNLRKLSIGDYRPDDYIGRPPVMPNRNTLYLLSTLGCGSGITGTEEDGDMHLQRGRAEVQEYELEEVNDRGELEKVTQRSTKITVEVLQNDGTFKTLN